MTFLPAEANSGIRFRRIDLEDHPEIPAQVEYVCETIRSTTLSKDNVKLHTVEHVLATFHGFEIDNAIVELDANEPPIADGSAREYCRMIRNSGIIRQSEKRESLIIKMPISVSCGGSIISIFPHESFKITCTSSDERGSFTQFFSIDLSPESWERELAGARTFCFFEEIESLIQNGLIRGGSLENAVIIRDDVVLTNEPLRYHDEFVRHKILDLIGDLSLLGRQIKGHIVAIKPSHRANYELAYELKKQMKSMPFSKSSSSSNSNSQSSDSNSDSENYDSANSDSDSANSNSQSSQTSQTSDSASANSASSIREKVLLDADEVMKILPHRYPFLMIDCVLKMDERHIICLKNVSIGEPYFQGHFPGHPIMPGVLQLEAMAQAAGILTLNKAENCGKIAYFLSAENVKWRRPVKPGDVLHIEVSLLKGRGKIGKGRGVCRVGKDIVSEGIVMFMLKEV